MKFTIPHAASFLSDSAAAKQGLDLQVALSLAIVEHQRLVSSSRPSHSFMSVGVGDACDDEMIALGKNSDLAAALAGVGSCPTSQVGHTVTMDGSACSAMGEYALACFAAGGKTVTIPTATITCTYLGETASMVMNDINECYGQSCNYDISQYANDVAKEVEKIFAAEGIDMACSSGGEPGASPPVNPPTKIQPETTSPTATSIENACAKEDEAMDTCLVSIGKADTIESCVEACAEREGVDQEGDICESFCDALSRCTMECADGCQASVVASVNCHMAEPGGSIGEGACSCPVPSMGRSGRSGSSSKSNKSSSDFKVYLRA